MQEPLFIKNIELAIQNAIELELEKAIGKAKQDVEDTLRSKLANITLELLHEFSIQRREEDIIITIRHQKE